MIVREYILENGSSPFRSWFDDLDYQASAKVATAVAWLGLGTLSNVIWIGGGLGEYRIDWGPSYRVYFAQDGDGLIILFAGGTKKRQQSDMDRAGVPLNEYKTRQAARKAAVYEMVLIRDFKETVKERAARDPAFAKAMLDEAATAFLNGEPHVARLILRDLVNASSGFEELATETSRPSKSLHRMLSDKGYPRLDNISAIFDVVCKRLGFVVVAIAVGKI